MMQGDEQRWQVTVEVPANAYKMDLVFADVESGDGVYDNCSGADYHLPVEGSKVGPGVPPPSSSHGHTHACTNESQFLECSH